MIKLADLLKEMPFINNTGGQFQSNIENQSQYFDLIRNIFLRLTDEGRESIKPMLTSQGNAVVRQKNQTGTQTTTADDTDYFQPKPTKKDPNAKKRTNLAVIRMATLLKTLPPSQNPIDANVNWGQVGPNGNEQENRKALFVFCQLMEDIYANQDIYERVWRKMFGELSDQQSKLVKMVSPLKWESIEEGEGGNYYTGGGAGRGKTLEHTLPTNIIRDTLIDLITTENFNQQNFDLLMSKCWQVDLNVGDDKLLNEKYKTSMPAGWDWQTGSAWARYQATGIDPQSIVKIGNPTVHPPYTL
jgi:hypothetical protein